ncbi:ribonuclease HII [Thermoanaerobacterium sp. DL9XJH110]|uniref:ribonuclease HII n=1 Tax=Thermoanaerobacterium sp. DL9XJH110 TaxID=3386643 RepID=UPI003BB4B62B
MENISELERQRILKLYDAERELQSKGYKLVAGVDEAGRGPLAGPVVAGAVILALDTLIMDLKDSKLLSEKKRERVYGEIKKYALAYAFDVVDEKYIDSYNILNATLLAMRRAVEKLSIKPDYVLVDALKIPGIKIPQQAIIHGDGLCACIAAASIVAKVERDRIMREYDRLYPEYGFRRNKGYGTKEHVASIREYGFCPVHRKSFSIKGLEI